MGATNAQITPFSVESQQLEEHNTKFIRTKTWQYHTFYGQAKIIAISACRHLTYNKR